MSLIHPAILYGLGLAVIPVLLHFLLRSKPKKLIFPALRLVNVRRKNNVRRMRLKHLWLMLLRMAVIALLVVAISRPSLPAANYSLSMVEMAALAAILVVAGGSYWGVLHFWKRKRLPNHIYAYRRSMLRGGTGLAALVLFLLLVAWPYQQRVSAEIEAPLPSVSESLPVAAVFLFDTSLSMEYQLENKTRLDHAQKIAISHLSGLPRGSRIAVGDTSNNNRFPFLDDLVSAQQRIESLQTKPVSQKLNTRLRTAIQIQANDRAQTFEVQQEIPDDLRADRYMREIYLFTDLAYSAWNSAAAETLRAEFERNPWIQIYLIDVGVEEQSNTSLSHPKLTPEAVSTGGTLRVSASLETVGTLPPDQTVELYVQNEKGKLIKQGQHTVSVSDSGRADATFWVKVPDRPINQGELRLVSSDPLAHDNSRYFTITTRPAPRILLIAPSPQDAHYLQYALDPDESLSGQPLRYDCTYFNASKMFGSDVPDLQDLQKYDAVCLINVRRISNEAWVELGDYVRGGGGLAVFLGMSNQRENLFASTYYQGEVASSILPGEPLADLKLAEPVYLDVRRGLEHPLLRKFAELNSTAELTSVYFQHFWKVKPAENASVIANFTDSSQSPALLERVVGNGRVVMLTSAVNWDENSKENWNGLPAHWTFLALADRMMHYLGQLTGTRYNFSSADDVLLALDPEQPMQNYFLRKPGFEQIPGETPAGAENLSLPDVDQIGHYNVVSADEGEDSKQTIGFSVNSALAESNFTRISELELDRLLGEERYEVSSNIEELTRKEYAGRMGTEVFSLVLLIVIIVFCGEHLVANRFYTADQAVEHS